LETNCIGKMDRTFGGFWRWVPRTFWLKEGNWGIVIEIIVSMDFLDPPWSLFSYHTILRYVPAATHIFTYDDIVSF